jgi:hypothetical protein
MQLKWFATIARLLCLLTIGGCVNPPVASVQPCAIVPPEQTLVKKELLVVARADLEAEINSKALAEGIFNLRDQAIETYQRLVDKDVACSMLLRAAACLQENGAPKAQVQDFLQYLRETQSCNRVEKAIVSIDNVVQVAVGQESLLYAYSVQLDVFVRNSGDLPVTIGEAVIKFDEHLRPGRTPDNLQEVTAIYAVTVDSRGSTVKGAELNSPAKSFYPNPGSPVLIVNTPIAQSLGPRSTDRFRIKIVFNEGVELRGPREMASVELHFNGNEHLKSKILPLAQIEPCAKNIAGDLVCR